MSAIISAPSRANALGVADARLSSAAAVIFWVFAEAKTSAFAPCLTDVTSEDLPGEKLWGIYGSSSAVHLDHLKERAMRLSARNQIPATVTGITAGEAIANVELDANGVRLVASITVEACRDLGLAQGTRVTALIKASEVILATDD